MRKILLVVSIASTAGCNSETPVESIVCPSTWSPAMTIVLRDFTSGAQAPFTDVRVVARSSVFKDSVYVAAITAENVLAARSGVGLAMEHPGTYDITVTAAGYDAWQTNSFTTVNNLKCGYASDTIVARLKRS